VDSGKGAIVLSSQKSQRGHLWAGLLRVTSGVLVMAMSLMGLAAWTSPQAHADSLPWIAIGNVTQARPTSGTTTFAFPVKLVHAVLDTVTVNYATQNNSATSTFDYDATSGTLTFGPGKTTATIDVTVNGTTLHTGNRTFYVNLSNAVNAVIQTGTGTGTIVDTTPQDYVSVSDATTTQGSGSASSALFTVSLSAPSANTVSVAYTTQNGSALAGTDYTYTHGTLSFSPGTTSETVSVPVTAESIYQTMKYFYLSISSPVNAALGWNQAQGTILNSNHLAYVTADDVTVKEPASGSTTVNVPVGVAAGSTFPVTVNYYTSNGSALAGTDYTTTAGTLTIPAGSTVPTVPVTVTASGITSTKNFYVNLNEVSNGATIWRSDSDVTIVGSSTYSQLAVDDTGVVAPTTGTTNATFTVTLSPPSTSTVAVDYATADGSATAGIEYTATSGALSFSPGQTSKTVTVPVDADTSQFSDTYFSLNLSAATGGATIDRDGYGIINAALVPPVVSVSTPAVTKPATGTTSEPFLVTLSNSSPNTVTVDYSTSNNSAVAGTNYTSTSGTLTFAPGSTSKTVNVPVLGNTLAGPDLSYYFSLSSAVNAQIAEPSAYGIIQNPNQSPTLSVSDSAIYKPQSGTTKVTVSVVLSSAIPNTVTVGYSTSNGSATAGIDYTAASGTLTFAPDKTSESISISIDGNTLPTGDRYFYVNLASPTNASIVSGQAVVDIIDSSVEPYVSVDATSIQKPATSGANATFTVTVSPPSPNTVTVNYATSDGSAAAGTAYTATSGTLTISPGQASKVVDVPLLASTVHTGDQYFYLNLSAATNALLGNDSSNTATIIDPTVNPLLTVNDASVLKPSSGTTTEKFNVDLDPASVNTVTVAYTTSDGSATAGTDYVATSGTLTFSPGTTTQQVSVTVDGSSSSVPDRYFYLNLSSPTNAQIPGRSSAYGLIVDSVAPTSGLSYFTVQDDGVATPNSGTATETFAVDLFPAPTTTEYVSYTTADGTATAGSGNYDSTRGTLTFAPGTTSQTVSVTVNGTGLAKGNLYFYVELSNNTGSTNIFRSSSYGWMLNAQADNYAWTGPDLTVNRGDSGSQTVNATVTLSAAETYPISVDYTTADGSATAASGGYTATSGTLDFAPGQTTQTVPITISGDPDFTGVQYFYFEISNAVNTTINSYYQTIYVYNLDTFTVSGTIINSAGTGISGVTVTRSGNDQPSVSVVSATNGSFSIPNTIDGVYTLTPALTGESFEPTSESVTVLGKAPASTPFIGITGLGIEGEVANSAAAAVGGVTLTLSGPSPTTTTTTDSLGYYAFGSVTAASGYVVTPSLSASTFNPASYTVNVTTATVKNLNFVDMTGIYISGRVVNSSAVGVSGVTITRSGGGQPSVKVKTNSQGYYGFSNDPASSGGTTYTLTPSMGSTTFTPTSSNATVTSTSSSTGNNFTS
jgi:hypothetical protein